GTKLETKGSEDIIFTDKKGKEHTLTKETQKAWLEAFGLKSLDEEAIVEIPADLKERLGKEIKLNKKDFEKLMKNKREKYIPQIKETFKEPEAVFIDENDDLIFTKTFNDKLFFVNVNRDYGEAFKALSLAPKKNNNLLNKLDKSKEILKLDSKLRDYTAQQAFTGVLSASNKSSGEIIPQIPKDNSQLNVLHTKIQQVRQQIAESKNPDKEYLHRVFKPDEIIELEKQYFNQAMPQEYKELIQDFPQLYEQRLANELKAYVKDTDVIQEVSAQLLNDFKDKSFKDTAKHAKLLLFNTLRDKAQELGFKELDINEPSFKVAFGKFQAKLKKGDIQDLSEHIAINSLQHDRLRIQEALNITPLKEFGTNYAEFYRDGKGAVEKLLAEKQGQVAGAFYKEGLGEIDLVWGDENFGLRHIIDKHGDEFEDIAAELDEIIAKGVLEKGEHRYFIKHNDYKGMIVLDYKGKESNAWILTLYKDKSALNPAYQHQIKHNTNTSSETRANGEFENSNIKNANLQKEKVDKLFHGDAEVISAQGKFNELEALNPTDEESIAQKAKNDEVLEAEVIEEVGLNEPMKFLEFQQRKLLTYIKENTPLKLLEHKKELKTRDILNFLEQSALNGKQKVFLMRNLERDFTKLKEDFKELESQSFKRDLLDKTKPLRKAEKEELTSEVLEQVQKENLKLYLNDTSGNLTKFLNAKKPFKITMRGANIKHILNRHGENSTLAKNGQPFVNLEDIKKYDEIINNADRQILKENDKGEKTLLSGKQINGHYIVISSVRLKNGELKLKTMYKENGKLENDKAFKSVKLPSETPSVLRGQSLTTDLDGYPSHADESIAQNAKSESEKEVLERQIPFIEAEIQKYEAKIASLDERIKKTQTRIQPYLDEINALQKQYDELYFTETRGEEANAKKWLKLEEIKAKQEELRKPYNDALFKFVFPHQRLKGKVQTEIQKLKFGLQDRALRLEEIQNEALNTSKAQKAWLEAFNLKSLEEAYIPNFKAEVKEAINRVLGGEEIKLTKGSFEKLLKRDREEFLPYIKDTLEKANAVIKQVDGALIFAKDYRNERLGKFFASVSRNDEGEWIITSNAPKNLNNLKNKLNEGGELLYSDLPELTIIAKPDLDANALNSEANLKDIIPQKANLEAVNKQKDKEFLEAYEKADFKGKVELAKQDINEEIKFLEKQKEEFERITQQKDYNDIELEQARKILENAKEEVEGHYRIKYMQNGKEMRAYISKTDYFNQGKILSKDEILHKIIQKTIYKDKIENIKKTSDKLKKQIKIIDEYLKEYGDNEAGAISDDIIEKFKYYNFAKDTGKGEIIIGERQKGLYEQAQKVLNSRFLKAKKRSAQSKKNYNITYDEARKLFYKGDMSEEQKELFQSVLPIAQKLNVRIRTAIREPYEEMMYSTKEASGLYRYSLNTATLKKGAGLSDTQKAQVLLHELIHSVTSRAMSLYKTPLRDKMLSKTQIKAIDEIDQIYKKLYKFKKTFKLQDENGADLYGIKNSHEMLAELANPMFSSKLKEIGLYEKLVNNIMKIILSVRDFIRLRSDKNVYEKLKQCLKDIIENYKDDFTQEYEKQNIRDFTLTSQTQKEQIYTQRQEIKNTLKAKINQAITNENTGEKAILTNKGISKMLSDKAISKSVDNGFSREEHLRAVGVVDELFKRAKRAFSKRDEKDKNLSIYRYNAPFKNANALMTLKEYKQNGKRIYSLELENLEAAKFNPSGKDLAEQLSKSKDADTTTFHTPIDNPSESIAQNSEK
ncbi:hypothetical protein JK460_001664, partial [Campylobacter upsaliensis]|nr:hypothetical protein [Campylobacter upsaliensis]